MPGEGGGRGRQSALLDRRLEGVDVKWNPSPVDSSCCVVEDTVRRAQIAVTRLAYRTNVDQVALVRLHPEVLWLNDVRCSAVAHYVNARQVGVADEEHFLACRGPGGQGVLGFEYVIEMGRVGEFRVRTAKTVADQYEREIAQECDGFLVQLIARPVQNGARIVIEQRLVHHPAERGIVVAHDDMIHRRMDRLQDFARIRTVADNVAEADDTIHIRATDIQQHGVPRL